MDIVKLIKAKCIEKDLSLNLQKPTPKRAEFTRTLSDAAGILEAGTPEEQRDLLLSIISRIELDGPEVSIHWKLS